MSIIELISKLQDALSSVKQDIESKIEKGELITEEEEEAVHDAVYEVQRFAYDMNQLLHNF